MKTRFLILAILFIFFTEFNNTPSMIADNLKEDSKEKQSDVSPEDELNKLTVKMSDFDAYWDEREPEVDKFLEDHKSELIDIKNCSFDNMGVVFYPYKQYFRELFYADPESNKDWNILKNKYTCNEVFNYVYLQDKERYTFKPEPLKLDQGIETGLVIAYGKLIKPPYNVTYDMNKKYVYINGIQIWPQVRKAELPKSKFDNEIDEFFKYRREFVDLETKSKKIYKTLRYKESSWFLKYKGKEEAKENVKVRMELDKEKGRYIYDYKLLGSDNLDFDVTLTSINIWDKDILPPIKKLPEHYWDHPKYRVPATTIDKFLNDSQKYIQQYLKDGKIIIISNKFSDFDYVHFIIDNQLLEIVNVLASNQNPLFKIKKVGEVDNQLQYVTAKELYFNLTQDDFLYISERLKRKSD
ncbi:MAG: hypothetical protein JW737_03730 [Acidobacteria bacterium]|nr:hypothetical protein [Acidobacteriota bacterium]